MCSRELAKQLFQPMLEPFNRLASAVPTKDLVEPNPDDFIVIQVDGEGFDAGQRVLEITSPLAMAGISIFFKTTYFSDYILVPYRARHTVTKALEQRGFAFSTDAAAYVSQLASPSSPKFTHHSRNQSSSSGFDIPPPSTPPARDVGELQMRTFTKLRKANIIPSIDKTLRLVSCSGSNENAEANHARLKNDLLQVFLATGSGPCITSQPEEESSNHSDKPLSPRSTQFLSLTLTASEPISVLLEESQLSILGDSLLGAKEDILIPIMLDLRELPLEATGIVCGVAGSLAESHSFPSPGADIPGPIDISFLSTARAGTVIVKESDLDRAMDALKEAAEMVDRRLQEQEEMAGFPLQGR